MPECAYGKAGAAREGAALFVWRSGGCGAFGRGVNGRAVFAAARRKGKTEVRRITARLSSPGVVGGRWRCPGAGGAFCVEKTGLVRSAEWMTLIESIASTPDVALDAGYLPDFRDAPGARRKPVLRRASAMPVPPSGAALILTGTRSAGHGEPSRQRAREQGVRVAEALPEMRNLSAGQTAGRVEGRGRGIWRATCIAE